MIMRIALYLALRKNLVKDLRYGTHENYFLENVKTQDKLKQINLLD